MVSSTPEMKKSSENRRSNKPIMEKRRRARINSSLNELKALILDAANKDPARHSKLEKADILEMTVKHLQSLQQQKQSPDVSAAKYRAGFAECAAEVGRFKGVDVNSKRNLMQHLANCLSQLPAKQPITNAVLVQQQQQQPQQQFHQTQNVYFTTNYVPSNSNGNVTLVVPSNQSQTAPVPLLVPIPPRSSSASSVSSASSSIHNAYLSPPSSPESDFYYHNDPGMQKPLSLVMKRESPSPTAKPWRPW